jgi:beta-glucanase (GH16 family)
MKNNKIYITVYSLLLVGISLAQLPVNDTTWTLVKVDNFDSLKTTDWAGTYLWGPVNNGIEYNDPANLLFNSPSGYLTIKCESPPAPIIYHDTLIYYFRSGAMQSKFKYKFGYYEISAICPKGKDFWPAFWLWWAGTPGVGACTSVGYYNEIDILENSGITSQYDQTGGGYLWADQDTCGISSKIYIDAIPFQGLPVPGDITQEHKYALFWEPNRLTWFFDDTPIKTIYDTLEIPQNALSVIINFALDWPNRYPTPGSLPAYFKVNYLKIWQLGSDCNTAVTFCNNFNASSWNSNSKVKKSITIGGSGCSDNINTGDKVNLWATDFVLLDSGTSITNNNSGSFSAQVTKCPN